MRVIIDCNDYIKSCRNTILDSYGYKRIINSSFDPDGSISFVEKDDAITLVVKKDRITFYGGSRHNHMTLLPNNKNLYNEMLSYLVEEGCIFQLTSIGNDVYPFLNNSNKYYDVPFPAEWHFENIQQYEMADILNSVHGKKRWEFKRVLRKSEEYTFKTLPFIEFQDKYDLIMQRHISYFSDRGKESVWKDNEDLLFRILEYFHVEEKLLIRLIECKQRPKAIYAISYNSEEMIYYFGSSLDKEDPYITRIMYFDMLGVAKKLSIGTNIASLNALRGAFANKRRFGFKPVPLYALVNDNDWVVQKDKDIDPLSYKAIYGRDNWGRIE